jgi:lantibiotic modifying enzyme
MGSVASTRQPAAISDEATRLRVCERARSIGARVAETPNDGARGLAANAGDAALFAALIRLEGSSHFEASMHAALKRAACGDFAATLGLFVGISGMRAAAELAIEIEPRYANLRDRCDAMIEALLPEHPVAPGSYADFDVIEGWAGARLARCVRGPQAADALSALLYWMLDDLDRFSCAHPTFARDRKVTDLGLAHGIAGVLSALALTHERIDARHVPAMAAAAEFLRDRVSYANGFAEWPHSFGRDAEARYRSAWCYGTPGVACALHAAARALGDPALARFAVESACSVAVRSHDEWLIDELGLCHGLMGNALCFASLGTHAGNEELLRVARGLVVETLDRLDGEDPDETGELKGSVGIAMALLTLTGQMDADWMRAHALDPI